MTGGIFIISTLTGFIIDLKEYIHRETSTEVMMDAVRAFMSLPSHINYFERLEALGYDNMCNLQGTIHNTGKKGMLNDKEAFFWTEMLYRTFVDSFHIAKHICRLCSIKHPDGTCCFDATLPKFKKIFKKIHTEEYARNKVHYTKINDEVKIYLYIYICKIMISNLIVNDN